jgi:hypothetical protein
MPYSNRGLRVSPVWSGRLLTSSAAITPIVFLRTIVAATGRPGQVIVELSLIEQHYHALVP